MKNLGEFASDGYGMAVISTDLLTSYFKEKKIRAKKLISYFTRNKEAFYDTIKAGRFLPFYHISCNEYTLFISVNEQDVQIPQDYNQVFSYKDFYIEVGELERICFASFNYLENHLDSIKQNITDKEELIPSGSQSIIEPYFPAIGFDLPKGIYSFDLIGLERKIKGKRDSKNYAYAFIFRRDETAVNHNFEKADNDKYCFNITTVLETLKKK